MACFDGSTNAMCSKNCYPLIQTSIPNQNKSHLRCKPICDGNPYSCCNGELVTESKCCQRVGNGGAITNNPNDEPSMKGIPRCDNTNSPTTSCYDLPTGHQRQCECQSCLCIREAHLDKECPQHVEGNSWQDLRPKSHDPLVQSIRDRLSSSEGVRDAFKWCPDDEWLTCVDRRFRQAQTGYLGHAVVHYGAAQDCDLPKALVHGVVNEDTETRALNLIWPKPLKTAVQKLSNDLAESIYESNREKPIGKCHDQTKNLPPQIDPDETAFGIPTEKDISAAMLINPRKTRYEVDAESNCCRPLYRKTHGNYNPGEQVCRNYTGKFNHTNTFGDHTPHDIAGRFRKKIIGSWRSCKPDPPFVSKVYADHLDQRLPKLGLPQDRLCIGKSNGDDFTYGKRSDSERERPIREIIFNRCPNDGADKAQRIMHNVTQWTDKVRKSFKSDRGADMESFYEELVAGDKQCNGTIDWELFVEALKSQRIPITMEAKDFMEALIYTHVFHPNPCNKVNYYALMDLIQGHHDPMFHCKTTTLKPYYLPHSNSCIHFRTTYADQTANMCTPQTCIQYSKEQRVHGMPSVRTDRVPNKIRSTKDETNYGDDGDAYSLLFPSVYTTRGVTCRDVFRELTQDQMLKILCRAGVEISHEEFQCVWELAKELDPEDKGRVCYQMFRQALCQKRAEDNRMTGYQEGMQLTDTCHERNSGDWCNSTRRNRKPNPCAGVDP